MSLGVMLKNSFTAMHSSEPLRIVVSLTNEVEKNDWLDIINNCIAKSRGVSHLSMQQHYFLMVSQLILVLCTSGMSLEELMQKYSRKIDPKASNPERDTNQVVHTINPLNAMQLAKATEKSGTSIRRSMRQLR